MNTVRLWMSRFRQRRGKDLDRNRSTDTGENVAFTPKLLAEKGREVGKVTAVHKPYVEPRTYATVRKVWQETELLYCRRSQRIKLCPARGFQNRQEIPDDVRQAYDELVRRGYPRRLVRG